MNDQTDNQGKQVPNPFGAPTQERGAGAMVQADRAQQEIQAAMVVAHSRPRDAMRAMDRIIQDCTRPTVAEIGLYAYPKGGETVSGPSIRLAELVAQRWGNLWCGVTELQQDHDKTVAMAWAWDLETNARDERTFTVPHLRHTRKGSYTVEDPREIYEMVANYGARRKRAAIQTVVPREVFDTAVDQVEKTLAQTASVDADSIQKMIDAFAGYNVTQDQLVRYIGHRLDSMITAEMVRLKKVYASIRDGFAAPRDFFGDPEPDPTKGSGDQPQSGAERFRSKVAARRGEQTQQQDTSQQDSQEQHAATSTATTSARVDHFGTPWDARIHAQSMSFNKDGSWRRKRNISDEYFADVMAELKGKPEPTQADDSGDHGDAGEGPGDEPEPQQGLSDDFDTGEIPGESAPSEESNGSGPSDSEIVQSIQKHLQPAREAGDLDTIADLEDEAREIQNEGWRLHYQAQLAAARDAIEQGRT